MKYFIISFVLILIAPYSNCFAQQEVFSTKAPLEKTHCPEVSQIKHDAETQLWGVDEWVSTDPSFEKKIVSFQGVQWVGTHLGTIICVYKSDNPTSFPITIQTSKLSPEPQDDHWGKYTNGRKNCPPYVSEIAIDVKDCPFYLPKNEQKKDIYEQLDFFKGKKNTSSTSQ